MSMGTFGTVDVYCDMTTADGRWIVIQRIEMERYFLFDELGTSENMLLDMKVFVQHFTAGFNHFIN